MFSWLKSSPGVIFGFVLSGAIAVRIWSTSHDGFGTMFICGFVLFLYGLLWLIVTLFRRRSVRQAAATVLLGFAIGFVGLSFGLSSALSSAFSSPPKAVLRAAATPPRELDLSTDGSTLGKWKGNGNLDTEAFKVAAPWAIEWSFEDTFGLFPVFGVCVKTLTTLAGMCAHQPVTAYEDGANTAFVHESGEFYLSITGTGSWTVRALVPD